MPNQKERTANNSQRGLYYLLFAIICIIWGTTWFALKSGIDNGLPSFRGAGIRFLLTAFIFVPIIIFRKPQLPKKISDWVGMIFLGIFYFFIPYACIYWSEKHIPSYLAAVIYGIVPLLVIIFSHFMLHNEQMSFLKVVSALIGISGVFIISIARNPEEGNMHLWGVIAMFFASISTAFCTAYTKKYVSRNDVFLFLGVQIFVGGLLLLLLSIAVEKPFTLKMNLYALISIIYLAVFGTAVAWTMWIFLISKISVVLVSYVSFFVPVVAVIVGTVLGNEKLSPLVMIGAILVLISILSVIHVQKKQDYFL